MKNFINLNKIKQEKLVFNIPGHYIVYFQNLSGEYIFELAEKNVHLEIYGLYTGSNKDEFKIKTTQLHKSAESSSNLLIKGVFRDQSSFDYQGLIHIEKQAAKVKACQKNQNLVLSKKVSVHAKPFLEILNNDVYCTHGFTSGGLNKEELIYLKTRGMSESQAEELLIKGFLNEILNILC